MANVWSTLLANPRKSLMNLPGPVSGRRVGRVRRSCRTGRSAGSGGHRGPTPRRCGTARPRRAGARSRRLGRRTTGGCGSSRRTGRSPSSIARPAELAATEAGPQVPTLHVGERREERGDDLEPQVLRVEVDRRSRRRPPGTAR